MVPTNKLSRYKGKRDFTKTPEPKGTIKKKAGHRYLIQKHAASHLHYDFRLELNGTLKSWAVPKGPSLDPHDKRLAMQVEDHPVSYGSFEGIIPKGQYGGGTVMLWDEGTWEPIGDPEQGLAKGKLVFRLRGKKLKGEWTLVKTFSKDKRGNSWLLIKHKDDEVREGDNAKFLEKNKTSVATGRTMEGIAAAADKVWKSDQEVSVNKTRKKVIPPKKVDASRANPSSKMPGFTPPQLATLSTDMPKGKDWVHEIKFDGYRMITHIQNGKVKIFSRNGKDWTKALVALAKPLRELPLDSAILDGEVVVLDAAGNSSFMDLKNALSQEDSDPIQYYVFDLLYFNGHDVTMLPLLERKELLAAIIKTETTKSKPQRIFLSEYFTSDDGSFLQNVCTMHLEGVVSKRVDAPYHSGRSKVWLKTKCQKRQEFVIGGFTLPSNGTPGVGSLLLGYYDDGELNYAGRVGTGFTVASSAKLRKKLEKLRQKNMEYKAVPAEGRRSAIWVKPTLVAEVEFTEWTPDDHLRHPSFKGLREDKPAKDIVKEKAVSPKVIAKEIEKEIEAEPAQPIRETNTRKIARPSANSPEKSDPSKVDVGGIAISHPSRVIYPDSEITKQQLAEYYYRVADYILPYIVDRPISTVRCPEGTAEPCFFQRHVGLGQSPYLHEVSVRVKGETRDYLKLNDVKGLLSLVQWGVIEIHPWECTVRHLEKPDRMIFDLDPDVGVTWKQLIEGTQEMRERLMELGLLSFLKTTGGKGLHVVVPITPVYGFPTIKSFAKAIAESMAHDHPTRYISKMSKAARTGKIFVDYLRNDVTATAVAPYSARARAGATVSTPLDWIELTTRLKPTSLTIETVPTRLEKMTGDPWKDFTRIKQKISAKYLKALKIEAK